MRPRAGSPPRARQTGPEGIEVVQGIRAGLAVVARRPQDVLRVAFARSARHAIPALGALRGRVVCEEMSDAQLDRLAESTHHEGLCVESRPRRWASTEELAASLLDTTGVAVALDRVRNPYNVGAILRSAAFFGLRGVLLGAPAPHPGLAPTAVRVAEGGAEHLLTARTTDLADTLARLRARGIHVVGADSHAPPQAIGSTAGRPVVLVVGNEREGLAARVRTQCHAVVSIAGSGAVESLNVAVAAAVFFFELTRNVS